MERERFLVLLLIGCPPVGCVSACSLSEADAAALRRRAAAVAGRARSHRLLARQRGQGEEQCRQQQHQKFGDVGQQEGQFEAEQNARLAEHHVETEESERQRENRHQPARSEERREGKEWVGPCRYRWSRDNEKKKKKK